MELDSLRSTKPVLLILFLQTPQSWSIVAGTSLHGQSAPGRPSSTCASWHHKLYLTRHLQVSRLPSVLKAAPSKSVQNSKLLADVDIALSSVLIMTKMWSFLHLLRVPSINGATPFFIAVCGLVTNQSKQTIKASIRPLRAPPTVCMQTKLAVTAVRGLIFHMRCQNSSQHFDTCLSFMSSVKDLCPDKQAIAEAFASEGKQTARLEFSDAEMSFEFAHSYMVLYMRVPFL